MEKVKKIIVLLAILFTVSLLPPTILLLPFTVLRADSYEVYYPTDMYIEGCGQVDMVEVYTYNNYVEVVYHCGFKTLTITMDRNSDVSR